MKIVSVVGARPQFIKLAPLSKKLREDHEEVIIHTGQHFDDEMSNLFFLELGINKPNYNFGINGGTHGAQTGEMLSKIESVLTCERPDIVIVFGDTNTTLAGALASVKLNIPAIHIEAGLRSFNRAMPEEINRVVSDHTCNYLFTPTQSALSNLENEGLTIKSFLTGDIMVDSLKNAQELIVERSIPIVYNDYFLLTLHRPYNVDDPVKLKIILNSLSYLKKNIIFPVHPRTKHVIEKHSIDLASNIKMIKPLGYLDFITLQANADKIITDSGGIQKEAFILKKPCITLRSETEWIETVESGWNLLLDIHSNNNIAQAINEFRPIGDQKPVFGVHVAENMMKIISDISCA